MKIEEFLKKIGAKELKEFERLPDGKWSFRVYLGRQAKARTKLWAKKVTKVDTEKKDGYAFEGQFFRTVEGAAEIILSPGEMAIAIVQTGSWKHPDQEARIYIATHDGVYSVSSGWGSAAENTKTIYLADTVLKTLQGMHESEIEKLKKEIAEKEAELEKLKKRLAELLDLEKNLETLKEKATAQLPGEVNEDGLDRNSPEEKGSTDQCCCSDRQ